MERVREVVVAFAVLVTLTAASCGGHSASVVGSGTPTSGSGTPVSSGIPSAWTAAPGWVKVATFADSVGESWAYGPYFRVKGGKVCVVGSLTTNDPSGSFQWEVRIVPRQPDGGYGFNGMVGVFFGHGGTVRDSAGRDKLYIKGISQRPLKAGVYRTAIDGTSGAYTLTVYVHK